jgi:hypothetical protein
MYRRPLMLCLFIAAGTLFAVAADRSQPSAALSAAAIVDKNVAARGGLGTWRAVKTMSLEGKMGAGGNQQAGLPAPVAGRKHTQQTLPSRPVEEVQLPFVMNLMRPHKMRIELQFNGQTAIQVFDGTNGWKLRPFLNRRVVETYTDDELKMASLQADLDGPLVDYAAKGTQIELAGMEKVEGHDTYKLKLTMKSGNPIHVWIDAQTFLEVKIEGQPRRLDGIYHPVEVYFRDYRSVSGLQIPYVLETKVLPVAQKAPGSKNPQAEKIIIDKVVVNPKLDASLFSKPVVVAASTNN